MGFLSHRVDRDKIKPGDHIYTWRTAFTYSHHGIYVGENVVVHFTSDQGKATSSSGLSSSSVGHICGFGFDYCGLHQPGSGVQLCCLNCFIKNGSLYRYQYGVNKLVHFTRLRGGTCTAAPSDPPQDVLDRAIHLLGEPKGFGNYDLVKNNCEDFALYCKTGLLVNGRTSLPRGSAQVMAGIAALRLVACIPYTLFFGATVAVDPTLGLISGPVLGMVYSRLYPAFRYKTDIGVRNDVDQVPKERVGLIKLARG